MSEPPTVEQMCRDLLSMAISDGLVRLKADDIGEADPQNLTTGELCGMANKLSEFIADETSPTGHGSLES